MREEAFNRGKTRGNLQPEDDLTGCLLADAANGFNNLSRLAMLWTVAHRWPRASRFAYNCYRHFPQLVMRVPGDHTPKIILSKEGVTQGDPMTMPLYGISVAVLAEQLKRKFPSPMQVWYANDFSATASGRAARPLMKRLGGIGPSWGVFPEPAKSQYTRTAQVTEEATRVATKGTTVQHEAGAQTLGGHIGSLETRDT